MPEPYQKKIVALMEKQETLLSNLYGTFADKLPMYKDFWTTLSDEEAKHASIVRKLYQLIEKGNALFDEGKIKTYTMNTFIEHLEKIKTKVESEKITMQQALTYALDFESSLLEMNVFAHFDSLSDKVKTALKVLLKETDKHIGKIRDLRQNLSD